MSFDLFSSLLSNVWSIFLVILFFGGSIFVHELGHFLAARRRGVHVARFSIGFGPKIFSWHGRDGVEYRLSWLPLGGYVALPQLADMRGIEGESEVDVAKLAPLSYATKLIVFAAGAGFNLLFALLPAAVIWFVGQPQSSEMASTRIGYVTPQLELPDGSRVPSPAAQAGLQVGDLVRAIDGKTVHDWIDLMHTVITSFGRTADGRPQAVFTIEREGQTRDIVLYPRLSGDESVRRVGIASAYELIVHEVASGSVGERAGFKPEDELVALDGQPMLNFVSCHEYLAANRERPVQAQVKRHGRSIELTIPAGINVKATPLLGIAFTTGFKLIHLSPLTQLREQVVLTFRTLWSLIHPRSDIGLSKMSGPVGIVHIFHSAAEAGLRAVLMFTILINVNLAIFNLLPIPVLDGGHMLFATLARLRGRALPGNFVAATQSVFIVLLFSMILYVSFFDVRRWARAAQAERAEPSAAK